MKTHTISTQFLGIDKVEKIIESKAKLALSAEAKEAVLRCRRYLDEKMATARSLSMESLPVSVRCATPPYPKRIFQPCKAIW